MRVALSFLLVCAVASSWSNAEAQFRISRRAHVPSLRQPGFFYQPFPWAAPIYPAPINPAPIYLAPLYTSVPYISFEQSGLNELSYLLKQLTREIKRLPREQETKPVAAVQRPVDEAAPEPEPPSEATTLPTILILRDGRRMETQNYAIADQTVWIYTGRSSTRISLSDLDLEATTQANADRGIRFFPPR